MEGIASLLKLTRNPSIRKPRLVVELSVSLHCMYLVFSTACWARSCAVGASGSTATIFSYISLRGCGRSLAICSSSSRYVLWKTVCQCLYCCCGNMYCNTRLGKENCNHIGRKIKKKHFCLTGYPFCSPWQQACWNESAGYPSCYNPAHPAAPHHGILEQMASKCPPSAWGSILSPPHKTFSIVFHNPQHESSLWGKQRKDKCSQHFLVAFI